MERRTWEQDWTWEGLPVLHCRCSLPYFPGNTAPQRRMERYWRTWEKGLLRWLGEYHLRCCVLAKRALADSKPLPFYQVQVETETVWETDSLLSFVVRIKTAGRERSYPHLWHMTDGTPASVGAWLPLCRRLQTMGKPLLLTEHGVRVLSGAKKGETKERFGRKACRVEGKTV